jgi:hypothetical protein
MNPLRGFNKASMFGGTLLVAVVAWLAPATSYGQAGSIRVNVTNPATNPVQIKAPARKPWQASLLLDLVEGETSKLVVLPAPPLGKRIVIEFGSAQLVVLTTQIPLIQPILSLTGEGPAVTHFIAASNVGPWTEAQNLWQSTHPLRLTYAHGSVRILRVGGSSGPFFASLSLAGYEEDAQ